MSVVFPTLSVVSIVISNSIVSLLQFLYGIVQLLFENAQNIEVRSKIKFGGEKICIC